MQFFAISFYSLTETITYSMTYMYMHPLIIIFITINYDSAIWGKLVYLLKKHFCHSNMVRNKKY